jgi:hypothetical protein
MRASEASQAVRERNRKGDVRSPGGETMAQNKPIAGTLLAALPDEIGDARRN